MMVSTARGHDFDFNNFFPRDQMKRPKFLAILVVVVLLFLSVKNSLTVTMNGGKTTAVCVREPARTTRRSRGLLSARESRFRYTDENGNAQMASIWISLSRPKAGDEVEILYAKDSPQLIYYNSVYFVWMLPAILGALLLFPVTKFFLFRTKSSSS